MTIKFDPLRKSFTEEEREAAWNKAIANDALTEPIPDEAEPASPQGSAPDANFSIEYWKGRAEHAELKVQKLMDWPSNRALTSAYCFECEDRAACDSTESCAAMHEGYPRRNAVTLSEVEESAPKGVEH